MASEISASTRLSPTSTAMRQRQMDRMQAERAQEYRAQQQAQERAVRPPQQQTSRPAEPVLNTQGQATGRLLNVQA